MVDKKERNALCHLSSGYPRPDICQQATGEVESSSRSVEVASLKLYDAAGPNPSYDGSPEVDIPDANRLRPLHIASQIGLMERTWLGQTRQATNTV